MAVLNLFRDVQFLGGSITVDGDVPDLNKFGFNDVISSITVLGGTFTLFTDSSFRDRAILRAVTIP